MFLLPDGNLVDAGPGDEWAPFRPAPHNPPPAEYTQARILYTAPNPANWSWGPFVLKPTWPTPLPTPPGSHGSAVMYEPGKIMICGGQDPAVGTTFVLDIAGTTTAPKWITAKSMLYSRRNHNLVMLPDGKVLAVGGNSGSIGAGPVRHAEVFDPASGNWTLQPPSDPGAARIYHSTAVLLRDGRVVSAGGNDNPTFQIFRPSYITSGAARPIILSTPSVMHYGGANAITYADNGAKVPSKACLIRLAAVTHGFDHDQRYVPLAISSFGEGFLNVQAPASGNIAPPGYYMLWILSEYALNEFAPCTIAAYVQVGP